MCNYKLVQPLRKTAPQEIKKRTNYDSAIPLLGRNKITILKRYLLPCLLQHYPQYSKGMETA